MNDAHAFCRSNPPDFRTLYVFGAGGSGREVAWLAERAWGDAVRIVFLVDHVKYLSDPINGISVQLLSETPRSSDARYLVAIGDPALRRRAATACSEAGHLPATLLHPNAEVSRYVEIDAGTVICAGTVITTNIAIGAHVQINIASTVSHDVSIGEFSTLSPGVHVSGNVKIGRDVFIGTNACIINGHVGDPLVIGDGAVIAAGACVTKSVDPGTLVAGVPAVRKR